MEESKIICDNDFLSSFLWVGEEDLLTKLFKNRLYVPDAVKMELEVLKSNRHGGGVYTKFLDLVNNKKLEILEIKLNSPEEKLMEKIKENFKLKHGKELGAGELQMITLAIHLKASFVINTASNNLRDIVNFIQTSQIDNITTMDVLCFAYEKKLKTFQELENIKTKMLARKRKLPNDTVEEYYNKYYIKNKY